jgi:tetratricopeptide (TPR) repeat protein
MSYFTAKHAEDRLLGSYRLIRRLGSGEYAAVYLGEHIYLKTQAAIKVLHTQLMGDELQVFLTEARALAHLVHPHIVRVLDFGVERGLPFLVMDYAPDGTLRQRHQDGVPLTCANVLHYVKQIASALQYAHYQGVIHRDIKPDNLLVGCNNEILLSDFGIAAQAHEAGREAKRPIAEGNCAYMAPEQFRGEPCPASDQYALGIMAYEWLTGGLPFSGGETEMMVQHFSLTPPSLRERCATVPGEVERVILRALSKRPEERFESVETFAESLARACGAVSPAVPLPPAPSQAQLAFQLGRAHHRLLVGREREWEALIHLLSAVELEQFPQPPAPSALSDRGARTGCALLLGELGIGKTRLAEDLSREAQRRGWAVAWGRGYPQESSAPYAVWVEVLHNLLHTGAWRVEEGEQLPAIPPVLRRFLPQRGSDEQAAGTSGPLPQQERALLWIALSDLFTTIAQRTPLLVVLDDLHWVDESSIELLAYLIRHLAQQRVLFVATYRQTELHHAHALVALEPALRYEQRSVKFALSPLTGEQIAQLLSGLPPARVLEIAAQAGGNPFFAEQLGAGGAGQTWERSPLVRGLEAIPATITAALERRVGQLSTQCLQLLSVAAVLRGSFSHRVLRDMMRADQQEEDRLLDLLDEAIEAGILVEEGSRKAIRYHFWHPLVVSYLYERLSAIRRVHLHQQAAETLLRSYQGHEEEAAAAVAFHLVECGSSACSIVRYAEMAGDHAFRLSAYTEASLHYHLAVEHLDGGIEQERSEEAQAAAHHLASLLERLAECCMIRGEFSAARGHYERILQLHVGEEPAGPTETEAVRQISLRALLWSEIVRALRMQGDYERGRECCQQARATLTASGIADGPALASLDLQQSYIDWQEGHYASARQLALDALKLAEQGGGERPPSASPVPTRLTRVLAGDALLLGEIHELLSNIASSEGQMGDALAHLAIALGLYEQLEDPRAIAHVTGNIGYTYLMRGEDELARMHLSRSFALAEQVGDRAVMSVAALNLGELAARSGDLQEAETWFKRSFGLTQQAGDRETEVWVRDSLAGAYRDQGKLLDALDCLRGAIRISRAIENTPCLGLALVALSQVRLLQAQAVEGAPRARFLRRARAEVARALGFAHLYTEPRAAGHLVLAQLALLEGSHATALQEATLAFEEARASDLALLQGRAERVLGAILAAQESFSQADQHFEQALQMCRSHHMELERARTLHLYAEALLLRCVGASGSAMADYQRGLNYLQEARRVYAQCHAALDSRQVELALRQAPSKKPFLGWF